VQPPRNVDPTLPFGLVEIGVRLVNQLPEPLVGS
jgi:hypothetical protein